MVARRVWTGGDVNLAGRPSPDGRYIFYRDYSTNDLALYELATGEKRRLTNQGSQNQRLLGSVPSPDGMRIAYAWENKYGAWELRIVGLDGSEPRVLYRNPEVNGIRPHGWSRDGQNILALFRKADGINQIVLVSVADGSVRVLESWNRRYPVKMSLSPDGRYVVYDLRPAEASPNRDIYLLSINFKGSSLSRISFFWIYNWIFECKRYACCTKWFTACRASKDDIHHRFSAQTLCRSFT